MPLGMSIVSDKIHSFLGYVQNATILCRSQELLPFLSVMYFFLPPFSTNYSSIPSHPILPSISWSTSQFCSQIHIYNTLLGILFSSILCTCPNQRNVFNVIVSITSRFFNTCKNVCEILNCITKTALTYLSGTDYELPEVYKIVSKHVGAG